MKWKKKQMTIVSFKYTSSKTHLTKFVYNFVRRFYLFLFLLCVWRRFVDSDVIVKKRNSREKNCRTQVVNR